MDKRFAIALACSLALHALLLAALRVGGSPAQRGGIKKPLLVYLRPDNAPPAVAMDIEPGQQNESSPPDVQPRSRALLPGIGAEERYLLSSEVDVRAEPVEMPALVYPELAQQMRISGIVRLKVYISESGRIDSVDVVESRPPGVFEEAALKALLSTSFTPAMKNGRAVKSQKLIEIKFDPYETISQP